MNPRESKVERGTPEIVYQSEGIIQRIYPYPIPRTDEQIPCVDVFLPREGLTKACFVPADHQFEIGQPVLFSQVKTAIGKGAEFTSQIQLTTPVSTSN